MSEEFVLRKKEIGRLLAGSLEPLKRFNPIPRFLGTIRERFTFSRVNPIAE
jgi:hypothetical protein